MNNVAPDPIYGIGLCAGALGLERGLEIAIPGYRTVAVVEREADLANTMAARVEDGSVQPLAWWDSIESFDGRPWRGRVHGLAAGFPCPDYSVAGKRKGFTGKHGQVWNDVFRIICEVRPGWCFLENVPGITVPHDVARWRWDRERRSWTRYRMPAGLWFVLGDLASVGFDAEWICLPASGVGASHKRERVFIFAYRRGLDTSVLLEYPERARRPEARGGYSFDAGSQPESGSGAVVHPEHPERGTREQLPGHGESRLDRSREASSGVGDGEPILGSAATVEHTTGGGWRELREPSGSAGQPDGPDAVMAEPAEPGLAQRGDQAGDGGEAPGIASTERAGCFAPDHIPGPGLGAAGVVDDIRELLRRNPRRAWERYQAELRNTLAWADLLVRYPWLQPAISQEETQSALRGRFDELADLVVEHRTTALRAVGNGVHSYQAAVAFAELVRRVR